MFISDLAESFQEAWDTFHGVLDLKPSEWSQGDWQRLADLCSLSRIADAKGFDALSQKLRSHGCVSDKETLIKIGKWKTRGRITKVLRKNKDRDVRATSNAAFEMIDKLTPTQGSMNASIEAIKCLLNGTDDERELKRIKGIGIPMASALLAMYKPNDFPVIDRLAFALLFPEESADRVEISTYRQWKRYLRSVQKLANDNGLRCRDIDVALWFVGSAKAEAKIIGPLSLN